MMVIVSAGVLLAAEQDGESGQVGQDLVLADRSVLRPGGVELGGAGVPVPAPVGGRAFDQDDSRRGPQVPQQISPASRYWRAAGPAGPRGALICWTAMKSASLTSAGWAGREEMTHPSGRFQRCTCRWPSVVLAGSIRSRSGRLAVPDLPAGVAGIGQDRHRGQRPGPAAAMRVALGVERRRAGGSLTEPFGAADRA